MSAHRSRRYESSSDRRNCSWWLRSQRSQLDRHRTKQTDRSQHSAASRDTSRAHRSHRATCCKATRTRSASRPFRCRTAGTGNTCERLSDARLSCSARRRIALARRSRRCSQRGTRTDRGTSCWSVACTALDTDRRRLFAALKSAIAASSTFAADRNRHCLSRTGRSAERCLSCSNGVSPLTRLSTTTIVGCAFHRCRYCYCYCSNATEAHAQQSTRRNCLLSRRRPLRSCCSPLASGTDLSQNKRSACNCSEHATPREQRARQAHLGCQGETTRRAAASERTKLERALRGSTKAEQRSQVHNRRTISQQSMWSSALPSVTNSRTMAASSLFICILVET